ncbi:H repeat-containing Rhs element protein [Escherichia coli]|uniref:H repeat-containing Rhs element protein n=1 Tax=Escherichia coli TaxID=562 RepID=A0A377K793_ECOLX|nr:H repeat-containing Rhs element protein [Escherichia coli]
MRLQLSLNFFTCWTLKEKSSQLMRMVARKILQRRYKNREVIIYSLKMKSGRLNKTFEEKFPLKELNNPEHDSYAMMKSVMAEKKFVFTLSAISLMNLLISRLNGKG